MQGRPQFGVRAHTLITERYQVAHETGTTGPLPRVRRSQPMIERSTI